MPGYPAVLGPSDPNVQHGIVDPHAVARMKSQHTPPAFASAHEVHLRSPGAHRRPDHVTPASSDNEAGVAVAGPGGQLEAQLHAVDSTESFHEITILDEIRESQDGAEVPLVRAASHPVTATLTSPPSSPLRPPAARQASLESPVAVKRLGSGASVAPRKIRKYKWVRKLLLLAVLFCLSLTAIITIFLHLPKVDTLAKKGALAAGGNEAGDQRLMLKLPRSMAELKAVRGTLELYQRQYQLHIAVGLTALYLFLQTFIIPGSLFLCILIGSMYGFVEALALITVVGAVGASLCYGMSLWILKDMVYKFFPDKCNSLSKEVHRHKGNIFFFIVFLRVIAVVPNWLLNLAAPIVGVSFWPFFFGTLLGFVPTGVLAVKAGKILAQITSLRDLYDSQTIMVLVFLGLLALAPVVVKRYLYGHSSRSWGKLV